MGDVKGESIGVGGATDWIGPCIPAQASEGTGWEGSIDRKGVSWEGKNKTRKKFCRAN